MSLHAEGLMREEELLYHLYRHQRMSVCQFNSEENYYLAANEQLQRQRCEHVETEAETRNINEGIVLLKMHQSRAHSITMRKHTGEKLFNILPCVLSVKTTYADIASMEHATRDIAVEMCVTLENRSSVGVFKLP